MANGDCLHRCRCDRVQVGDDGTHGTPLCRTGYRVSDVERRTRGHDGEDDVGCADEIVERRQQLDPLGELPCSRTTTFDGRNNPCAPGAENTPDRGAHRTGTDDADRDHGANLLAPHRNRRPGRLP